MRSRGKEGGREPRRGVTSREMGMTGGKTGRGHESKAGGKI